MIVGNNYTVGAASSGMPITEDEYDHHYQLQQSSCPPPQQQQQQPPPPSPQQHQQPPPPTMQQHAAMSKAEQRRSNKPIMEKRRRARINHCLNELKTLILDAMKKDPARHSKLEKADILEMTVKHLQSVQRQQLTVAMMTDPNVMNKFKSGFSECAGEVSRFISRLEGVDSSVKQRLIAHLANCITGLQQLSPFSFSGIGTGLLPTLTGLHSPVQQGSTTVPEDVNNNSNSITSRLQMPGGLQLIPSRLPTGELALLVPNSTQLSPAVLPFFTSTTASVATSKSSTSPIASIPSKNVMLNTTATSVSIDRSHPSAFTAVTRTHSPSQAFNRSQSPTRSIDTNGDARHTVSPLPLSCDPDYSSSSGEDDDDDDSLISDSYLSPNSPLTVNKHGAYSSKSNYQENQSHSQNPHHTSFQPVSSSLHFKITSGSLSGFKPYHQTEPKKPPQQPTVTSSTSENSPESSIHSSDQSPNNTFTEVKLQLKTIPMSSHMMFPDLLTRNTDDSFSNFSSSMQMSQTVSSSTPVQLPLPVIAYNEKSQNIETSTSKTPIVNNHIEKDPLDFSFRKTDKGEFNWQQASEASKKRPLSLSFSDQMNLCMPVASPSKIPRHTVNVFSHNNISLGDNDDRSGKDTRMQCGNDVLTDSIIDEESVASSSSCVNDMAECLNRDMWRPW